MKFNIVAHTRNYCFNGKVTMLSVCVTELQVTANYIKCKKAATIPELATSWLQSANLTRRPRRNSGCTGEMIVVRKRENFTVDFACSFWLSGGTSWSFCFVRNSLFSQSLKQIGEDSFAHSPRQENQSANERDTVQSLCYCVMEDKQNNKKIINLKIIMWAVNEKLRKRDANSQPSG